MSDGPQSPDLPRPTTEVTSSGVPSTPEKSNRFGWAQRFIGRGNQADSSPRNLPEATANQSKQPEVKNRSVLQQLHEKNEQLGDHLTWEYGEGEGQFTVTQHQTFVRGDRFPNPLSYGDDSRNSYHDRLIVTPAGSMILKVKTGEWEPVNPNSEYGQRFPEAKETFNWSKRELDLAVSGEAGRAFYKDRPGFSEHTEGSRYSQNGSVHTLNFGQDHTLTFTDYGEKGAAFLSGVSKPVIDEVEKQSQYTRRGTVPPEFKTGSNDVLLVLKPNGEEVAEIMKFNLEQAKNMQENARRAAEEERQRKEQEAQAAAIPTPEPKPDQKQQIEEAQTKATDTILNLLSEPESD